jgi:hypothetical protein
MDPRTVARVLALGRVAIGAALFVAPARVASGWVGEDSRRPGAQVALTAVGARDLVLGAGAAWALGGGAPSRPWLLVGAIADTADLAATLRHRQALATSAVIGVGALAGGSAALGLWLQSALD